MKKNEKYIFDEIIKKPSYNMSKVGKSGSGVSVFMQEIINKMKKDKTEEVFNKTNNIKNSPKKIIKFSVLLLATILISCSGKNNIKENKITYLKTQNQIVVDNRTDIMFLSTMYFDFDSYVLNLESKQNLNLLARYLKDSDNKHKNVILSGYCDELGTDEYNYKLGLKRAEEVQNYLVSLGINKSRISVKSYGKRKQEMKGGDEKARQLNRKVIISFE